MNKHLQQPMGRSVSAARQLLGWRQHDLARAAGLSVGAVQNVEMDRRGVRVASIDRILAALNAAGAVVFQEHPDLGSGVGIRRDPPPIDLDRL